MFIEGGVSIGKEALHHFPGNEKSEMHRESCMNLNDKTTEVDVRKQLGKAQDEERQTCCAMFLKLMYCIHSLARQGVLFYGHCKNDSTFEGNLYQLLLSQANDCPLVSLWLKEHDYFTPHIVNEMITIYVQSVL